MKRQAKGNYLSVTQGLAGAGGALVQLVPLALHYVRKWFLGRTPRQAYSVLFSLLRNVRC